LAGAGDFSQTGGGEDGLRSHVDLVPRDVAGLGAHRIRLESPRPVAASVVDGRFGEGIGDPPPSVASSIGDTGDGPDGGVGLVLPAALPRHPLDAEKTAIFRTQLHRAPSDWIVSQKSDQPAGGGGVGVAAVRLGAQSSGSFFAGELGERLAGSELVPLAVA